MTKGTILLHKLKKYAVVRVRASQEYIGERVYTLRSLEYGHIIKPDILESDMRGLGFEVWE